MDQIGMLIASAVINYRCARNSLGEYFFLHYANRGTKGEPEKLLLQEIEAHYKTGDFLAVADVLQFKIAPLYGVAFEFSAAA